MAKPRNTKSGKAKSERATVGVTKPSASVSRKRTKADAEPEVMAMAERKVARQARTPTGKKASPDTRAAAEHRALEGVRERTEAGHRMAGREPEKTGLISKGAVAVRKKRALSTIDSDIRDVPMLTEDEKLLQSQPESGAFTRSDPWRVMRITSEFVEGFDALS
ncbi:MAG: hypothetical protein ABI120_14135, partial [Gemmatimonadaceae bacterium]